MPVGPERCVKGSKERGGTGRDGQYLNNVNIVSSTSRKLT